MPAQVKKETTCLPSRCPCVIKLSFTHSFPNSNLPAASATTASGQNQVRKQKTALHLPSISLHHRHHPPVCLSDPPTPPKLNSPSTPHTHPQHQPQQINIDMKLPPKTGKQVVEGSSQNNTSNHPPISRPRHPLLHPPLHHPLPKDGWLRRRPPQQPLVPDARGHPVGREIRRC